MRKNAYEKIFNLLKCITAVACRAKASLCRLLFFERNAREYRFFGVYMEHKENAYFGSERLGKLIIKFAVPCILSLLIASLYNLVDQIFIGNGINYLANGATNVVFPITVIALALALLVGDGCAAFLSLCQGRGDRENAHRSVANAISFTIIFSIVLTVLFVFIKEPILWAFGATQGNIGYAREYFDYILIGLPFYIFANAMNSVIRADGSPAFALVTISVGCVMNIILDPIAIFALHWGVMGAALATVAGQVVSAVLAVIYLFKTRTFRLQMNSFRPQFRLLGKVCMLGISSFLTQLSIVVTIACMNNTLIKYGAMSEYGEDIPLTVLGIVMKVFQIVIAFVVGIAAGSQPIIGYNYGAGNMSRVRHLYKIIFIAEAAVGLIAFICFECFPVQIISIFGSGDELYLQFAALAFRIYLCTIILCCVQKATSIFLQALGKPALSMALSLLRDFVLSVPLILLLPLGMGLNGALLSAPIADAISFVAGMVIIFITLFSRKAKSAGGQNNENQTSDIGQ